MAQDTALGAGYTVLMTGKHGVLLELECCSPGFLQTCQAGVSVFQEKLKNESVGKEGDKK